MLNKKIQESIREGHTMWWEYRAMNPEVRTDSGGYCLIAQTVLHETGWKNRVNFKTPSFSAAMSKHQELSGLVKGIEPPKRSMAYA